MITAKAIWTDNERYIAEATSRHALVMDTATEKSASSPMELVLYRFRCRRNSSQKARAVYQPRSQRQWRARAGIPCGVYGNQSRLPSGW
jgi:hypothetical protein